jgi:hypothetical protein
MDMRTPTPSPSRERPRTNRPAAPAVDVVRLKEGGEITMKSQSFTLCYRYGGYVPLVAFVGMPIILRGE